MAYEWSARCTVCTYGVRTGSYVNISARAAKHARTCEHVVDVSQGGVFKLKIPSQQSTARCESTMPYGF